MDKSRPSSGAVAHDGETLSVRGVVYKGLLFVVSVALVISLAVVLRFREQLLTATRANKLLRQTLGSMTVAITEKDRQIGRLEQSPCATQQKSQQF